MIRNLNYAELELWKVGRHIMYFAGLGKIKKSIKKPKDLFELEDEIVHHSTEATEKQKILFEQIKNRKKGSK